MLEDKLLVLKLKRGSEDALRRIYEKYKDDLLALAVSFSYDRAIAEDALHDVFVAFVQYAGNLRLRTSLKSYLSSCIANRVRNLNRAKMDRPVSLSQTEMFAADCDHPGQQAMSAELYGRIDRAMGELPYPQREVIVLHVQGGMRFRAIAESQGVSINAVQSQYRYGLDKLRSLLNDEADK
jgi:RNA polymerase sigma-70 factor (ECF subfamily)